MGGAVSVSGISLALYEPDIPPNVGAMLRLGACLSVPVHIIEPCGFPFSVHAVRRQAMDYAQIAEIVRHDCWADFAAALAHRRIIVMTTKGSVPLWNFAFQPGDIVLMGRETAGLPDEVHAAADARVFIPIDTRARSLNVATAAAIALGEACRQLQPPSHAG